MNEKNWKLPFFTIWIGQALSRVGSSIGRFALIWWLTDLTGSAVTLTTASLVAVVPIVLLNPIAGAYVDRWNRRKILIVSDSFIALISFALAVLFWTGQMQIWHVYVVIFLRAIGSIFHGPAMTSSTSLMVPENQLSRVAGMNQTLGGVLGMVGPPLGAIALSFMSLHFIMLLDVVTALFAIIPLFFIGIPQPVKSIVEGIPTIWNDIQYGFRYIWSWKGLFIIMIMAAISNFFYNPIITLLPLYVKQQFGGTAAHLGGLQSAQSLGIVLGGLLLSTWGGFRKRVTTTFLGQILQGAATVVFGLLAPALFPIALGVWGFAFFCNVFYNGPLDAMLQAKVKPEIQGRVFTSLYSLSWVAWPVSLIIAGPLTDKIGIQPWIVTGGTISIIMGILGFLIKPVQALEDETPSLPNDH